MATRPHEFENRFRVRSYELDASPQALWPLVAARLADLSEGGAVVMSGPVHEDPGVAEVLADPGLAAEAFRSPIRGLEGEVMLWRARVPTTPRVAPTSL